MAALQDIHAALATKAYPDHLHYKLSLRWMACFLGVFLNLILIQGGFLFEGAGADGGVKR